MKLPREVTNLDRPSASQWNLMVRALRALSNSSVDGTMRMVKGPDGYRFGSTPSLASEILAENDDDDYTIPPWGLAYVKFGDASDDKEVIMVERPSSVFCREFVVNGPDEIKPHERGPIQRGPIVRVLCDLIGVSRSQTFGPAPNKHEASRYYNGLTIWKKISDDEPLAWAYMESIRSMTGLTTATIGANSLTTSYKITVGPAGGEDDAGWTTVPQALNRGEAIQHRSGGRPIGLTWVNEHWEASPLDCRES